MAIQNVSREPESGKKLKKIVSISILIEMKTIFKNK